MRISTLFMTLQTVFATFVLAGNLDAQNINLNVQRSTVKEVFTSIEKQTDVSFVYNEKDLQGLHSISLKANNLPLIEILKSIANRLPLSFKQADKVIGVSRTMPPVRFMEDGEGAADFKPLKITGKVIDEKGLPVTGTTILLKGGDIRVIAGTDGSFTMEGLPNQGILSAQLMGYQTTEVSFDSNQTLPLIIVLKENHKSLDEVQVIGYGTTTKRLNTGSVSTITARDIEEQPVANVLSALSGRAPGVFVQTTNGLPGGNINIQIRGKGSILAGTDPLYIVDGVPFASSVVPNSVVSLNSIEGAPSPFNSLNPSDIESISILKDADATAIYGSRGTNGVVLITTKKGKSGKTKVNFNLAEGVTRISNLPRLLNNEQYLQIRREAFTNSNTAPTTFSAPDLLVYDTTKSTNWAKYYLGGTGHSTNAQGSISGGDSNTTFNISGNFRTETTILPGNNLYQRGGLFMNLQHTTPNKRFSILISASYTSDNNLLTNAANGISNFPLLPPDYPIYLAGALNWNIDNPQAELQASSKTNTNNLVGNAVFKYNVVQGLDFKISTGFNKINIDQTEIFPSQSLFPGTTNYTDFGTSSNQSVIIEPQINYTHSFTNSTLSFLTGATYQSRISESETIVASNFSTQSLMGNVSSAGTLTASNSYTQYRYESLFGRATYNINDIYIVNGTIRRDGSSRFAPGNQFGNFGSLGAAWLFTNEGWIKNNIDFLSFGKLRANYGITGNDQIPDYQYLSTYGSSSTFNYQGISALVPTRVSNADFHWETTRKLEFSADLGFLKDRILLSINRYESKSKDQLIAYSIPYLAGFANYEANLPAVVKNTGWEFELNTQNIKNTDFKWSTSFNITVPKNELESFQNFASSSYSQKLQLGYDITRIYGYQSLGVDPGTGKASYATQVGSTSTAPYLFNTLGKQTPDFYGGFGNSFTYKQWSLNVFGQFAKQKALGGLTYSPGIQRNNYAAILNRWTKPGDQTNIPQASTISDSFFASSSLNFFDASYFRLKNIALSYNFTGQILRKLKVDQLKIFAEGQNIFTLWNRNSAILDPESGALSAASRNIPPMTSVVTGLQLIF